MAKMKKKLKKLTRRVEALEAQNKTHSMKVQPRSVTLPTEGGQTAA